MTPFTFNTSASIRFGSGILSELGTMSQTALGERVVVITDPGMMATGLVDRVIEALNSENVEHVIYTDVKADPPEEIVLAATDFALNYGATGIIGFGGGSSLDVAKLVAVLARGAQNLKDIYGIGNISGGRLPLLLIPTTSGTGSEVTPISIITTGTNEKMGVVSPVIIPDIALLDPDLTIGLPAHITAATGIDAMVHAIEAYASKSANNNPISRNLAKEALRLMGASLETAVHEGHNVKARGDMLLGSMLAGRAFANSPVAAVHALAYPLGGHYKIPHGLSNALVLPHVLRFNALTAPAPFAEIAPFAFPDLEGIESQEGAAAFAEEMAGLSARCGLPQSLREVEVTEDSLPMLAKDAMNQTRLLVNNPREVTEADALHIYKAAY